MYRGVEMADPPEHCSLDLGVARVEHPHFCVEQELLLQILRLLAGLLGWDLFPRNICPASATGLTRRDLRPNSYAALLPPRLSGAIYVV